MFKGVIKFFKSYPKFVAVIASALVGGFLDLSLHDYAAHIVLGTTAIILVLPMLWDMYETLRDGEFGVDLLAAVAIISSVLLHEYWAATVIILMLTGGEALEDYSEERAKKELTSLISNAPNTAHLVKGRQIVDIKVPEVAVGQTLEVRPGELVPVDCIITEGTSTFDESSLTGESLPVEHTIGDKLLSGSINGDTVVRVKALETSANSQYEQIVHLVEQASQSKANFVRMADRYSIPFTIIAFAIAGTAWAISGSPLRFLQVIVVATPCPLLLAAPIAIISGMSRAAKHGVIVKNGSALERLAAIRSIAFDKTGTLTKGDLAVDSVTSYDKTYNKEDVLRLAATLERGSGHVLAQTIAAEAQKKGLKLKKASNVSESTGFGVSGSIGHQNLIVGKLSFLKEHKVTIPKTFKQASLKSTAVMLAVDGALVGSITFVDEPRPESKATIAALEASGIRNVIMITGDNSTVAKSIGKTVGITEIYADCLPADKLRIIKNLDEKHLPVAFVGDGVNDAPVLAAADVGIAIGARGSTAASESADIVVMLDDLAKVSQGVAIAKRSIRIGLQSILIGIFISVILMVIFSTGRFKPVYGAALQELVDVIVIINALRAHRG